MVCVTQVLKEFPLVTGEGPVAVLGTAVSAFTRVAGYCEDGYVALRNHLVNETAGYLHLRKDGISKEYVGLGGVVGHLRLLEGNVLLIPVLNGTVNLESVHAEAVGYVADVFLVHVAGACASRYEVIGTDTVQGNLLHTLERQDAVVLKQDKAFCGGLADQFGVAFKVRVIGVLVALETRGLNNVFKHIAHAGVNVLYLEGTVLHGGYDFAYELVHSRLKEVVDGTYLAGGVAGACPVSHHYAVETPFLAEDGIKEVTVFLGIGAVYLVVGRHDGPGL